MWATVSCVHEVLPPRSKHECTFTRNTLLDSIHLIGFETLEDYPVTSTKVDIESQAIYKDTLTFYSFYELESYFVGCDTFATGRMYYAEPIAIDSNISIIQNLYIFDDEPLRNHFQTKITKY